MARGSLRYIDAEKLEDHYKILTYDGYWSRVMYFRSQKKLTHRKIWELIESDLEKLGSSYYTTFISFKQGLGRYINKQESTSTQLDNVDLDCRLFGLDGYWALVMEARIDQNHLTIEQIWKQMEQRLSMHGLGRYQTFTSFTTVYSRVMAAKLNK